MNQQKNADYESDNVKDKNNLATYNQWSCGEYTNDLTDMDGNSQLITITSEDHVIGNKCIKLVKPANVSYWANISFIYTIPSQLIGETFNLSCYVKTTHGTSCQLYKDSSYVMNLIQIPATNIFTLISVSFTVPDAETLRIAFPYSPSLISGEATLFIDNFIMNK